MRIVFGVMFARFIFLGKIFNINHTTL
jgi:hypothetical protein